VTALRQGLKESGYVEGQNVAIEYRSAENDHDRLTALVSDFTRRPVAVIAQRNHEKTTTKRRPRRSSLFR
jgi:hypothetical protein